MDKHLSVRRSMDSVTAMPRRGRARVQIQTRAGVMTRAKATLHRMLCTVAATLTLFAVSVPVNAESSVWQVSKGDETVFLGGTIHLLRAQDYPLPEAYAAAYDASDRLFFEIDQSQMADMGVQARMMQRLTYQDERTLQSVLDDETYAALAAYAENAGLPMAMMQKFKPGMLLTTLSLIEFQSRGFTPQGVDAYYSTRAMGDGKTRGALETIDEQIDMLAGMGEGYESEFVAYSLRDLETIGEAMDEMLLAWRSGDLEALESQFIKPMLEEAPELYESMLVERNNNWVPQIEAMFDEPGTEFVLVGAAHLVGEHGVLAMLSDRGYEVSKVGTAD
ncbi:TraB/GumN family protein [Pseudohongiella acticola]|jgi:uncharacterized protein|uniref:TraB/GumN family protein n=1 Tax=Pseudohongiella acticola TaxID=1524254 RepID=UPI0030EC7AB7